MAEHTTGPPGADWPGMSQPELRRRHEVTPRERAVVAALVAAGVLAAVLLVDTASGWVGTAQAAVLVGVVGLAGTRAGRWTLAVLCGVGVALASGPLVVTSALGLLGTAVLWLSRARSRTWGAGIAVLGALGLFQLRDFDVAGLSALVASVAVGAVLVSGYRRSRSRVRRIVRRSVLAVAIVAVVVAGAGMLALAQARSDLESAVDATVGAAADATRGRTDVAAAGFTLATEQFSIARASLDRWWAAPVTVLPVVGDNFRAVRAMASAGQSLTATGAELTSTVDYRAVSADGGGVDTAVLAGFREPVARAAAELSSADRSLEGIRSTWLLGPVDDRLSELLGRVGRLRDQVGVAAVAAEEGPALLGAERPRRYLVLLGSPAELRDLGGHLGNWAEVVVDAGRIDLVQVGKPLDLSRPEVDAELAARLNGPAASMLNLRPATFPQNWGGSPDFDVVTALSSELFERATGRPVDGVLYADASVLDAMLGVTGPVPVPGLDRTLSAGEAEQFVAVEQYSAFPTESAADESVRALIEDVFERFSSSTLPDPAELGDAFGPLVRQGRLRMATTDGTAEALLVRLGLDRALEPPPGGDLLAVVNRNANPSKIDVFLERDVEHRVAFDPRNGRVRARTTVELHNAAPTTGYSEIVIGNRDGLPTGTNLTDVAVLSPLRLSGVTVGGEPVPVTPSDEGPLNRYTVRVPLASGQRSEVVFDLEGSVDAGEDYVLRVVRQPLIRDQEVVVSRVDGPAALEGGRPPTVLDRATVRGSGSTDVRLRDRP